MVTHFSPNTVLQIDALMTVQGLLQRVSTLKPKIKSQKTKCVCLDYSQWRHLVALYKLALFMTLAASFYLSDDNLV